MEAVGNSRRMKVETVKAPKSATTAVRGAAFFAILLGLTVIAGWYAHLPQLVQIRPSLAPMQFNTALCFLISGIALGTTLFNRSGTALVLGITIAVVGILTFSQYVFTLNFGIDELLFKHYILTGISHAGRMSPLTAVVFSLTGTAIISVSVKDWQKSGPKTCGLLGSLVVGLGTMAMFGYFSGLAGVYGWGQFTQMALHTAIGAIVLGLGLMATAWRAQLVETSVVPGWMPLAAGIAAFTATFILWNSLTVREKAEIGRTVSANAETVRNEITARLDSRRRALNRMAKRWEFSGRPVRDAWEVEAMYYVTDFPGYQGIAWADADSRIRWVVPLPDNADLIGKVLGAEERRRGAFEKAGSSGVSNFSRPVQLINGGIGILLPTPMFRGGEVEGYVVGAFEMKQLLDSILPSTIAPGYSVTIREAGDRIYRRTGFPEKAMGRFGKSLPLYVHGAQWTVEVEPGGVMLTGLRSPYPLAVLVFGTMFSGLLALSIHLVRGATARSLQVARTNSELTGQIAERKIAEHALQELGSLQRGIVTHAAYSVISTTPDGTITSFNPAAELMLGYSAGEIVNKADPGIFHDPNEVRKRAKELSAELGETIKPGFDVFVGRSRLGEVEHREWTYIRKDGSRLPVNLGVTALRDQAGEITGYLGIAGDISELKHAVSDLETTHAQLVTASHRAGMAEVATSVLHNVGNVLNSVNTSCAVVADRIRDSRIESIAKTAELLRRQGDGLAKFVSENPRGKKLPDFLEKLAARLREEREQVLAEVGLLSKNIDHIKEIVTMQQGYAMVSSVHESVSIVELIEDSIRMNSGSLNRHAVAITRDFADVPLVSVGKHKALQILINLISNAKHACQHSPAEPKEVIIRVRSEGRFVTIDVIDNGTGIPEENMTRIFTHGFTTKKDGHGFGLHGSALGAKQMGGSLAAHSAGPGKGATFSLTFPIAGTRSEAAST